MHEKWMRKAIDLSLKAVQESRGGPFGAVVVKDDRLIGQGCNQVTSTNDPTAHAEIVAIREACRALQSFRLEGCFLYTSCEPCPMCLSAIYWARCDQIFYANTRKDATQIGFDDEWIQRELFRPTETRSIQMRQLMHFEAQAAFELWNQTDDKILY